MSLPSVTIAIKSNGLGQVPASRASASVSLGICSEGIVGQLYQFQGDTGSMSASLGQGPLPENVAEKQVVAGQAMAMPLTPSSAGALSSVDTSRVAGTGTLSVSAAPAKTITIKIQTGGALATMKAQFSVDGGAYSAPVTSVATSWAYLVPGTLTTVTFSAHTYTADDVWTVSTTGVITVVGSGTAGWVTQVSSPLDTYDARVTIDTTGTLGAGVFKVTMDGGNNTSGQILIPSGAGNYAVPNTGVVLNFSGTFTAKDDYRFTTTTATFGTSDVTAAIVALRALATEWRFVHVVGMGASAAAAASMASAVDTQMALCETEFRYVFGVVECPTNGSPGGSTESDSTVASAFATFTSDRVAVCARDVQHQSLLTGRYMRRNVAIAATAQIAGRALSVSPAEVGDPPKALPRVKSLYSDESTSGALDAARFITPRTHIGPPGYFITRGNMMAVAGSDFSSVMNRSVVDEVCRLTRSALLVYLNSRVRVNKKTGYIDERDALTIERTVRQKVLTGIGDNAIDVIVAVKRDENILSTHRMPVSVGTIPFGYAEYIPATVSLINPAVVTA